MKQLGWTQLIVSFFCSCFQKELNQFLFVISIPYLYKMSDFICLAKEFVQSKIVALMPVWIRAISFGIRLEMIFFKVADFAECQKASWSFSVSDHLLHGLR